MTISSETSEPRIHDRGDALAEFGARGARGAQHVAGGELDIAAFGDEPLGLRALPGRRRAEQDQVHSLWRALTAQLRAS